MNLIFDVLDKSRRVGRLLFGRLDNESRPALGGSLVIPCPADDLALMRVDQAVREDYFVVAVVANDLHAYLFMLQLKEKASSI